jgi:hypothetical protein
MAFVNALEVPLPVFWNVADYMQVFTCMSSHGSPVATSS